MSASDVTVIDNNIIIFINLFLGIINFFCFGTSKNYTKATIYFEKLLDCPDEKINEGVKIFLVMLRYYGYTPKNTSNTLPESFPDFGKCLFIKIPILKFILKVMFSTLFPIVARRKILPTLLNASL